MKLSTSIYDVFKVLLFIMSVSWSLLAFFVMFYSKSFFFEWEVFYYSGASFNVSLIFDWMSLVFLSVVSLISACIMQYSKYYMEGEVMFLRFSMLLVMFVGSMAILIVSPNLVSLLLGWDGLGLTSYVLIIYYQNESSCNSGMLTILSNRIGDVMILMSIGLLSCHGSWSFYMFEEVEDVLVVGAIILAGMTKSAQLPFSAWLPAAMAAPTPVSSLVHSSTLVTAGIYVLIRFYPVMSSVTALWQSLMIVSVSTMFIAGLAANFEVDVKKVVALSTLSQLGLMSTILSMGLVKLSFFHLITHAMFKSSLFMCVGFIMHNIKGDQDGRSMSGFVMVSPVLMSYFVVVNMALAGLPFLAGFYSKDLILENMFMFDFNNTIKFMLVLGTGFTFSYSLRIIYLISSGVCVTSSVSVSEDMDKEVMASIMALIMMSVVVGFYFSWVYFSESMFIVLTYYDKYLIMLAGLLAGGSMYFFVRSETKVKSTMSEGLIFDMLYLPEISRIYATKPFIKIGMTLNKIFDMGWLEYYGGKGGEALFLKNSMFLQLSQKSVMVSGYIVSVVYLVFMVVMIY
uniref:NADH-ubiquinone oxidoreductase chain 5 n=1 Tax=Pseudoniphargus sp. 1-Basque TaxID=2212664 RepID=A0A345UE48_9CRUS|nr:NADH dehydrogenase subunit 5 [Pseudoniphargus sp. 1-Basque]